MRAVASVSMAPSASVWMSVWICSQPSVSLVRNWVVSSSPTLPYWGPASSMVFATVCVPSAAMVVTVLTVCCTPSMTSVPVLVMTRLTCSLPSASVSVVVWVVTLAPSTRAVWVAVTVETTSRTASMLCVTFFVPSAAVVVMVLTSERTPSTI